ncbi:hypothetical protein AMTRI_Chr06g195390 [Amborella trichopoda]
MYEGVCCGGGSFCSRRFELELGAQAKEGSHERGPKIACGISLRPAILLQDAQPLQALPPGTMKKNLFEWELQVNRGILSMKLPSQAVTLEHLPRGLVLTSCLGIPPILMTESSSEEEDLSPRSRNWS